MCAQRLSAEYEVSVAKSVFRVRNASLRAPLFEVTQLRARQRIVGSFYERGEQVIARLARGSSAADVRVLGTIAHQLVQRSAREAHSVLAMAAAIASRSKPKSGAPKVTPEWSAAVIPVLQRIAARSGESDRVISARAVLAVIASNARRLGVGAGVKPSRACAKCAGRDSLPLVIATHADAHCDFCTQPRTPRKVIPTRPTWMTTAGWPES